jgi:hypothetical protein
MLRFETKWLVASSVENLVFQVHTVYIRGINWEDNTRDIAP